MDLRKPAIPIQASCPVPAKELNIRTEQKPRNSQPAKPKYSARESSRESILAPCTGSYLVEYHHQQHNNTHTLTLRDGVASYVAG